MTDRLFTSKSDWNPRMWKGAEHKHNPKGDGDWNIAHVRNSIASYGRVPQKHHERSVELLDTLLSNHINLNNYHHLRESALFAVRRMHAEVGVALAKNDILRVKALIETWERDHGNC